MSNPTFRPRTAPMGLFAGAAAVALLIGWTAGVNARSNDPAIGPEQASLPASSSMENSPSIPLGRDNAREVQNQLIALGFDPGPADGQIGPATIAAAQQYDLSRGGSGQVPVDGLLLARLKADTAPRLTYDQVAARSRAAQPAQTSPHTSASAPAAASNQFGDVVQQIAPLIGAAIANSNNNRGYYGPGPGYYGPGPGYYGPPPGYYGYGYGGY